MTNLHSKPLIIFIFVNLFCYSGLISADLGLGLGSWLVVSFGPSRYKDFMEFSGDKPKMSTS